jgi:hypothetical protein
MARLLVWAQPDALEKARAQCGGLARAWVPAQWAETMLREWLAPVLGRRDAMVRQARMAVARVRRSG